MKFEKFLKINLLILCICFGHVVSASDITLDFLRNQAFENNLYEKPEVREVSLFDKTTKKKKTSKKAEVEHFAETNSPEEISITDKEYIQKFKRASNKKIRKKQIDITIQKNITNEEETLSEEKNKLADEADTNEDGSLINTEPKDKKFFSKFFKKKPKENKQEQVVVPSNLILSADVTDYFPERNEIEAKGNAKLEITGQNFELYGDKIIFNHDTNCVRAYNNVKIIQGDNVTAGDFINMDMNIAHGWIQKPISSNYSIRIKANEAYVYPDKIEEYDGVANITEDKRIEVGSGGYASLLKLMEANLDEAYIKKPEPTSLKFKVKDIDVESKDGHNVIRMKNVDVYYKKFKIGMIPRLKLVTDKEQTMMQTNMVEIGSDSNMGMYFGPSIVLETPLSSSLKISPLIVYSQDEKKLGVGASAVFMSGSNLTQMAYGSAENKFMLRGYQKITPKVSLNYSQNMYVSQWFLGYRRPMYSAELEYTDNMYIKDLGVSFEQHLSGGAYSDYGRIRKMAEGRLRWMTQLQKNLYTYTNRSNTFKMNLGLIGQTSLSQYTSGDTFGIVRIAPTLTTTYKGWSQNIMYFQSGASGRTPFIFDDYYYGKSNLQLFETLKINKYISLGYLASMALGGRETYYSGRYNPGTGSFLQENLFLVSIGPDEAKVTITYDAHRQTTAVYFSMLLGSKDMDVAFKKSTIHNPDTLIGENKKLPFIKNTFDKIRYKVFPLTDPNFDKNKDLYPQENQLTTEEIDELDKMIEEEDDRQLKEQLRNQISPFIQNQELMKDNRM